LNCQTGGIRIRRFQLEKVCGCGCFAMKVIRGGLSLHERTEGQSDEHCESEALTE